MNMIKGLFYYLVLIMFTFLYNFICDLFRLKNMCMKRFSSITKPKPNGFYENIKYYYAHCYLLILKLFGVKIYINGDLSGKRMLWISNHRSKFDGLLVQSVLCAAGSNAIAVVKKSISFIPLFGSFGNHSKSIFIQRGRSEAEKVLSDHSRKSQFKNRSILVFPEGATMSVNSKQRSDEYSQKNNLPIFKNVLLPRKTGFDIIKNDGGFDKIGNITIRYADPELINNAEHSFLDLLWIFPKRIYIDISYESSKTINLYETFGEKDKKLGDILCIENYQPHQNFPSYYSSFWLYFNLVAFVGFYLILFMIPVIRYVALALTIISTIELYLPRH